MRVFVTGGTGLIGGHLAARLLQRGDQVVVLTRREKEAQKNALLKGAEFVVGNPMMQGDWASALDGCDSVVNLAGHNLFAERWDDEVKRSIRDSRGFSTGNIVAAMATARSMPRVLVQASAIGFYGPRGEEELTESASPGDDFMARVCREWEAAAQPAVELGARLAIVRTGVVLAQGAGALAVMTPIFKRGGAAPIGNGGKLLMPALGKQWMSWVHIDDIVGLFLLGLVNPAASGPINGTAPNPVRNAEFTKAMKHVLAKPYLFWRYGLPIGPPDWVLRLVLGEVADVITQGQRVIPARARELGYSFQYPRIEDALVAIYGRPTPRGATSPARLDAA